MPNVPALARFHKLVDDISRRYVDARRAQVRFALPVGSLREETGRRIVEEEQDGAMRAQYGTGLLLQLSKTLSEKYGAGFSKSNLLKMRRFYLLNRKESVTTQLDWTDYVELLPVKDERTRATSSRTARISTRNCSTKVTPCAWPNEENGAGQEVRRDQKEPQRIGA